MEINTENSKLKKRVKFFGVDYDILYVTAVYYGRSVSWLTILITLVTLFGFIPQKTVAALKSIILYVISLAFLLCLKAYSEQYYELVKWFCTPGATFLRSWTSLFFFMFLVQLPVELSDISPVQILSWVFQCILGNFIALGLTALAFTITLYFFTIPLDETLIQDSSTQPESGDKDTSMNKTNPSVTLNSNGIAPMTEFTRQSLAEKLYFDHMQNGPSSSLYFPDELSRFSEARIIAPRVGRTSTAFVGNKSIIALSRPSAFENNDKIDSVYVDNNRLTFNASFFGPPIVSSLSFVGERASARPTFRKTSSKNPINENVRDSEKNEAFSEEDSAETQLSDFESIPLPLIPTMDQIFLFWVLILVCTSVINFLSIQKTNSAVISFQICLCILIFMLASTYRMRLISSLHWTLQAVLQSPVIFTIPVIILVILSSPFGFSSWTSGLNSFLSDSSILQIQDWGAGNYLAIFLDPAIVSLSLATVDPIIKYRSFIPLLIPVLLVCCALIYILTAALSLLLQSPPSISLPLLAHSITTPIAVAVSEIVGCSPGLAAATAIFNGVLGLRVDSHLLDLFRVSNPVARGCSAGTAGTLLGVVALDERQETMATGIGMVGYAVATVIFAVLIAIGPFETFIVSIT